MITEEQAHIAQNDIILQSVNVTGSAAPFRHPRTIES